MNVTGAARGYALAIGATLLCAALAYALTPLIGVASGVLLLIFPVALAAAHAGRRPALAAMSVGAAAQVVASTTRFPASSAPGVFLDVVLYAGVAAFIIYVCDALQRALRRMQRAQDDRQAELDKLTEHARATAQYAGQLEFAARTARVSYWEWDLASGRVERTLETGAPFVPNWTMPRELRIEEAWNLVHPDDRAGAEAVVQQAIEKNTSYALPLRLQFPNGAVRWVEVRGTVAREGSDRATKVFGIALDIDESRRAEEKIRESEERFRSLVDYVPVLLWSIDTNGSVFVNREYQRFTGVADTPGGTEWWRSAAHRDDVDDYIANYTQAMQQKALFEAQVRLRRADGEYRWFKSIGVPRYAADGTFLGYSGCSFDISEIKQYISELARAEQNLREADRRKNRFLVALAHALRNPLNPIRNAVSILGSSGSSQQEFQWARGVIDRQVGQLARLLDNLTDVARMTENRIELRRERVDVREVVAAVLESTRPQLESKEHHLDVTQPEQPLYIYADSARLRQAFANLLSNAAKYTDNGGRISVTLREDSGSVRVAVKDNGIGIAPEHMPRIFDMFSHIDAPHGRAREGLGIGLGLARGLLAMHGGQLDVTSEGVGKGSEFVATLPLADKVQGPATAPARPPAPRTGYTGLRILVADDVRDSAEGLAVLLRIDGNEVRVATDGVQALSTASELRPDVAVLDIGMPKLTGYEVARRLRKEPWGENVVLIALTGWGQQDDIRRALEVGFNYHMIKPVNIPQLQELLEQLAARKAREAHEA